jgi:hypothetical protein
MGAEIVGATTSAILDFIPEKGADDLLGPFTSILEVINLEASVISWLGSFPSVPGIELGDGQDNLPEMPGGFPYDIVAYLDEVNDEANDDKQVLREHLMWGWRTAVLALDLVFFAFQDSIVKKLGREPKEARQRLRRSIEPMIAVSTVLSVIDLAFTITFLRSIPEDDEDRKDTKRTEIFGILPGLCPWLRLAPGPFALVGSGALSFLDILAMQFSLSSHRKSIDELRRIQSAINSR